MASNYKYSNDYFGINNIISAIIAIFIGSILGIIVRLLEGNIVAGIVRLIITITGVGALVLNIVDFVMLLLGGKILRLL